MADLLWPGDELAGLHFDPIRLVLTMVDVEQSWLDALVGERIAPHSPGRPDLDDLLDLDERHGGGADLARITLEAAATGNPVVPLLALLRERLREQHPEAAQWLHRGLTSQDVLDTALMASASALRLDLLSELDRQVAALVTLTDRHRDDLMAGRTLTQHAVPITFGLKAARWLQGVLDARDDVRALRFPVQVGGAAGTLSAVTVLAGGPDGALRLVRRTAHALGLDEAAPWHTSRAPFTRYADVLVRASDAFGHVANDVLLLARPEIAELAEPAVEGRGGSSTMPQKANPVLSVLVRRAALAAPLQAAQVHLAAADAGDERPDGAWHTEWSALATLSRRTLAAAVQTSEVLEGLHVDTGRMAGVVRQQASALLAERRSLPDPLDGDAPRVPDPDPSHYLGATGQLIDRILQRAREGEEHL